MRRTPSFRLGLLPVLLAASTALAFQKAPPAPSSSAAAPDHAAGHKVVSEADIAWADAPPILPPGAKIAVLQGDPGKPGMYTMRLKIPDGYKVAAHWHPRAEQLTVLTGTFHLATGDKFDTAKGTAMKVGSFAVMPAKMHHYAWAEGETVVQASGMGPFQIFYVDPKDDPSKPAKK
jgi:hypothetical protein